VGCGILLGVMSAVVLVGQAEPGEIKPIAKEYLLAKVPNFFVWDYQFEPEPGKRIWIRVDEKTFVERFPSGKENRFAILGRANREEVEGIIVQLAGSPLQAFVPIKGGDPMRFYERASEDDPWQFMGAMQKVE
jgi:hypothetical protein